MKKVVAIVFVTLFLGIGSFLLYIGILDILRAGSSMFWPSVQGVVVESYVEQRSHILNTRPGRSSLSITHNPYVLYRFNVHGDGYSGNRIKSVDLGSSDSERAIKIVDSYPEGRNVSVFYLPENPNESLLEPGLTLSTWFRVSLGVAFIASAILMLLTQIITRKVKNEEQINTKQ